MIPGLEDPKGWGRAGMGERAANLLRGSGRVFVEVKGSEGGAGEASGGLGWRILTLRALGARGVFCQGEGEELHASSGVL